MGLFGNNKKKTGLPTQMVLFIRILIAGYLIYLSSGLFQDLGQVDGTEKFVFAAFAVFFVIGAVLVGGSAILGLKNGAYVGGKMDPDAGSAAAEDNAAAGNTARITFDEESEEDTV